MDSVYLHVGHEPQLFVDDWLIECTQGLTRRWHKPVHHGDAPLISRDQAWEQTLYFTYSNYNVIKDPADGLIKCWYEDLGPIDGQGHPRKTRLLYAESEDGLHFHKPPLDVCVVDGKRTNIVMGYVEGSRPTRLNPWADVGIHSNAIVIDPHAQQPEQRFRTLFTKYGQKIIARGTGADRGDRHGQQCAHSADGVHWQPYPEPPVLGNSGSLLGDVSCIHYDEDARLFMQNTRHGRMREVARPLTTPQVSEWFDPHYPYRPDLMCKRRVFQTRSHDFLHWSDLVPVSVPDDRIDNLDEAHYGMQQFRVGRLHLATLGVFRYVDSEMEVRLLFSRDGLRFRPTDRARAFLAPRGQGHWDTHMVSMTSQPIEMGDEWWFYHGGTDSHHDWWIGPPEGIDEPEANDPQKFVHFGLGLAKLRREGIASLDGSRQRLGYVLTRPLMSPGVRLLINARCREGGSIRAEVLDLNGRPIDNCSLAACNPFMGDSTCHTVTWGKNQSIPTAGQWRKIHFQLRDAEIFSFRLAGGP